MWRASTRSFIRFQAGAQDTRNGAQIISSGAALAITGAQGAEYRSAVT